MNKKYDLRQREREIDLQRTFRIYSSLVTEDPVTVFIVYVVSDARRRERENAPYGR